MVVNSTLEFRAVFKAGLISGFFGMGANNIWSVVAGFLGATIPPAFALSVTVSSLIPAILASFVYYVLARYLKNGYRIFLFTGVIALMLSFIPIFTTPVLPDGTIVDETFPLLVAPMHVISGVFALYGIPKWSA